MSLEDHMAKDTGTTLTGDGFGKPITYLEPGPGPKPLRGIVERKPPELLTLMARGPVTVEKSHFFMTVESCPSRTI